MYLSNSMTLYCLFRPQKRKRSAAIRDETLKWKDNTVPYRFQEFSK